MNGHVSIDYEYDYIIWFRTNSALSNKTHLTKESQMQKINKYSRKKKKKKKATVRYIESLRKLCCIITSLSGRKFFFFFCSSNIV